MIELMFGLFAVLFGLFLVVCVIRGVLMFMTNHPIFGMLVMIGIPAMLYIVRG